MKGPMLVLSAVLLLSGCAFSGPFSGPEGIDCSTDPGPCIALGIVAAAVAVAATRNGGGSDYQIPQ